MPEYPATILIAIGAVIAALIAAVLSFVSLISSKEEKISEFRQAWINSIREEMSCFISLLYSSNEDDQKKIEQIRDRHNRILFRLNPIKDRELIEIVNNAYRAYFSSQKDEAKIKECVTRLQDEFPQMLKVEWERVKAGEFIYKISKWAPFLLILVVLLIVWALLSGNLPFAVKCP